MIVKYYLIRILLSRRSTPGGLLGYPGTALMFFFGGGPGGFIILAQCDHQAPPATRPDQTRPEGFRSLDMGFWPYRTRSDQTQPDYQKFTYLEVPGDHPNAREKKLIWPYQYLSGGSTQTISVRPCLPHHTLTSLKTCFFFNHRPTLLEPNVNPLKKKKALPGHPGNLLGLT